MSQSIAVEAAADRMGIELLGRVEEYPQNSSSNILHDEKLGLDKKTFLDALASHAFKLSVSESYFFSSSIYTAVQSLPSLPSQQYQQSPQSQ